MADYAHRMTEKYMQRMEKKVKDVYRRASDEIELKLKDYYKRYEKKDNKWRQWVKEGKKTNTEYKKWRKGQLLVGKRWEQMKDSIAHDYRNADKIARGIINGEKAGTYALNHNWTTYEIEKTLGIDTNYTLYNREAVERIITQNPRMLPPPGKRMGQKIRDWKTSVWTKRQLHSVATQAIVQGESIPKIAERLAREVGQKTSNSMIRNARTMMTGAQNAGRVDAFNRARGMGIEVEDYWLATIDERTRTSHRLLDGTKRGSDGMFANGLAFPGDPAGDPEEVYNCFIPETKIGVDSKIIRSYKHRYDGEVISIKSSMGVNFTCTPNHPILTDRGWVSAKFLNEGDNLIVTSVVNNEVSRRNPNINHAFPCIDAIHELFYKLGGKRTSDLRVNFHGDIPTSEVEIVTQKRFLWSDVYTCIRKCINKLLFKGTNSPLMCKCSFVEHFRCIVRATFSNVSCVCKSFPFINRCVSHSHIHGLRTIANRDVVFSKNTINNLPTNVILPSEIKHRLASNVFLDNVVSVERSNFSGHVYNLQTDDNYYFVNSSITNNNAHCNDIMAIAHNCRCTLIGQIKGFEDNLQDMDFRLDPNVSDMTYEEWQKARPVSRPIDYQKNMGEAIRIRYNKEYATN